MLKKIFITGLATLVPVIITIYIFFITFRFVDGILGKLINKLFFKYFGYGIPGLGFILFVVLIFVTGSIIHISRKRLLRYFENLFLRIPYASKVYSAVKNIVHFVLYPPKKDYKSVVLVEYPRHGVYSLGFITKESFLGFNEKLNRKLYNVYIPTTPNPFTGMVILVPAEEVVLLDISVEEAIKFIASGCLLNPYD